MEEEEEERAAIETKPNKIELEPKLEALSVAASPCLNIVKRLNEACCIGWDLARTKIYYKLNSSQII